MKAKKASLYAKYVAAAIIILAFVVKIWVPSINIDDAIKVGLVICAIFGVVDLNITIDKFLPPKKDV